MTTLLRPEQIRTASLYPLATLAERTAGTIPVLITRYWPRGLPRHGGLPAWPGLRYSSRFAPSKGLLLGYREDGMTWGQFATIYRQEVLPNLPIWRSWMREQLRAYGMSAITLLCHEHDAPEDTVRCHRRLLREMLLEQDGTR